MGGICCNHCAGLCDPLSGGYWSALCADHRCESRILKDQTLFEPERNVKTLRNLLVLELKDFLESYGVSCDFPPRGDYSSVDLIADIFGEKTVFSIREGNDQIHNSEVQSVAASLSKHGASHGVILVDGLLPIEAKRLAESYGLEFKRYQKYKEEVQEALGSKPNR